MVPPVHYPGGVRTTTIHYVRHRNESGHHALGVSRDMSSTQKRGFRLPWADDRGPEEGTTAATLDRPKAVTTTGAVREGVGRSPVRPAEARQQPITDAAPAAADVPSEHAEAAMIDADNLRTEPAADAPAAQAATGGSWPVSDRSNAPQHAGDGEHAATRAAIRVEGESRMPRRGNPLVAGLVKAMREAAVASREETGVRLQAEAEARIEAIRARATIEAAALRKRADEDVAGIREWSKAEMAKLRQKTEDRIEGRRTELAGETDRHAASVDRLVQEVQTTVSAFEADMERFFKRLLAENDPARLATLAEQAPDPPDLRGDGPPAIADIDEAEAGLEAEAAAEAEAEATEGLDMSSAENWPAAVMAAARRDGAPDDADTSDTAGSRLLVSGLTSVAGISAFKGALGQLPGIRAVSVSSGERGVFIFAVHHDPEVELGPAVLSLQGFDARITRTSDDGLAVLAHEPAA